MKRILLLLLLLPTAVWSQQSQVRIKVGGKDKQPRVDTLVRVETLTVYKTDTLNFYRTDTVSMDYPYPYLSNTDTVRRRTYVPIPIPIPLHRSSDKDCPPPVVFKPETPPGTSVTPEPSTFLLVGSGLAGLLWRRRRKPPQ